MGLFSGLDKFGLGEYEGMDLLNTNKQEAQLNNMSPESQKTPEEREQEAIYDKHYECSVCGANFINKCVKAGKVKLVGKDTDLRPIYDYMDPIKYDVVVCDKCGYAALTRYYGKLSTRQMKDVYEQIGSRFSGIRMYDNLYSYEDAIMRYKFALITSVVKKAKKGEIAYTSLKLAWVLRGYRLSLPKTSDKIKSLYDDELESIKNAYEGFVSAISNEPFPIAGMDESTLKYIMADLARKLKKFDESAKLLGDVIVSKGTNSRLKEEALNLKDLLKEDIKMNSNE